MGWIDRWLLGRAGVAAVQAAENRRREARAAEAKSSSATSTRHARTLDERIAFVRTLAAAAREDAEANLESMRPPSIVDEEEKRGRHE